MKEKETRPSNGTFDGMGGVYAAMITPFTKDDKVNEGAIDQLIEYGIESGLRGFYLTGGTGEFTLMTVEERKQVFRRAAKATKGRAKLIAHVGATRTDDAAELARYAEKVGCDWVSSVAPIYFGQNAAAQYAHYKMISEASGLPLMIYCFGNTLVPERDLKLFDLKNVKGMKYTGSDYYAVQSMRRKINKETFFVSGRDEMLGCAMALGDTFQGGIGTSYNMIPKHFVAIYEAAMKGDGVAVAKLQCEVNQVIELLLSCPNWSCWKAFMLARGIDVGCARMPCGPVISEKDRRAWAKKFSNLIKTFTLK